MNFENYPLIEHIKEGGSLRDLDADQTGALCAELRSFLSDEVKKTGGHLASNLGVVELTVALHRILDLPGDRIVFDVGHQSYVHKILSGRADEFDTLRQPGGLSGFTKRSESEYDPFGAGHSSTSVSAAIGFARADKLMGRDNYTVAVLGDGAFTGGIVHEALNNITPDLHLIIILNENEMSISKNIGTFARRLVRMRSSRGYVHMKSGTRKVLSRIPLIGKPIEKSLISTKRFFKNAIYGSNLFEDMGLFYIGPADGHDEKQLEELLKVAIERRESVLIHIETTKGKGYEPAERAPSEYHSVLPAGKTPPADTFSKQFGRILCAKAEADPSICAVTAAMADGCGLIDFAKRFPDRFFDVGIAEEHAAIFSAGLAAGGMKPVFAVYSTFLQRAYDCVLHDVALQKLPVVFAVDRAGLAFSDGPTHHGIYDVSFLSSIPDLALWSPAHESAMREAFDAAFSSELPAVVRYPSGEQSLYIKESFSHRIGSLEATAPTLTSAGIVIVTYGRIAEIALKARDVLKADGVRCEVILQNQLRPYPVCAEKLGAAIAGDYPVLYLEEGVHSGGAGENFFSLLEDGVLAGRKKKLLAIGNGFLPSEAGRSYYDTHGIGVSDVVAAAKELIQ